MSTGAAQRDWRILVPVRGGPAGKTRLTSIEGRGLRDPERVALAATMAADTIAAAVQCGAGTVQVLTGDDTVAAMAAEHGAQVHKDHGRGLNVELAAAAATADPDTGVCVVLGDIPTLRPQDLSHALALAARRAPLGIVVPDWEGSGTALVATAAGARTGLVFAFGPDSAVRHEAAGLRVDGLTLDRLRCDVDTPDAWDRAVRLGLGPATAALRTGLLTARQ